MQYQSVILILRRQASGLFYLRPGIPQCDGTVEDRRTLLRFVINTEITEAFELKTILRCCRRQAWLNFAGS